MLAATVEVCLEVVLPPEKQCAKLFAIVGRTLAAVLMQAMTLLDNPQFLLYLFDFQLLDLSMSFNVHGGDLHLNVLEDVIATSLNFQRLPPRRNQNLSIHPILQQLASVAFMLDVGQALSSVNLFDL